MIGLGFDENAQFCRLFDLVQLFPNAHSVNISNNFQILWMSRIINLELGLIDGTVSPVPLCFSVLKSSETILAPERSTGYLCYCSIQDSCLLSGDKDRNLSNSASLVPAYRIQIAIATLVFNQDFGL